MTPAAKRYTRRFLFWMAIYSVAVIATSSILDSPSTLRLRRGSPWR
jgi:hypothetical protein